MEILLLTIKSYLGSERKGIELRDYYLKNVISLAAQKWWEMEGQWERQKGW